MSDEFKKFIETNGKTLSEIKTAINNMVNKAVDSVIDDMTQLVPRETRRQIKQTVKEVRKNAEEGNYRPEKILPRKDDINYSLKKSSPAQPNSPRLNFIEYPRESVPDNLSPQDEFMLDKIREMRSLETGTYERYIRNHAAAATFVKQGDFMADIEDDFPRKVFCALPKPVYAAMSNSQLRTYFTWRTDVRRGKYAEVDKPYVLLYCYELMNKIGVSSSDEAFERLLALWKNCGEFAGYLDAVMPRWLKDFYAFNDITDRFPDISGYLKDEPSSVFNGSVAEIDAGRYSDKLDFLSENSAYNLKGSAFFTEETRPLLNGACEEALNALDIFFKTYGIQLSDLLCGKLKKDYSWSPFFEAPVAEERQEGFHAVNISAAERYCIKRGVPSLECFEFAPSRGFIGYVLKCVESELRVRTGFKHRLTPNTAMLQNDFINRRKITEAISDEEFLKIIPDAVKKYCDKNGIFAPEKPKRSAEKALAAPPRKVEIDISLLEKIREQSEEIAKKLIVDETNAPCENEIERIAERVSDDELSEKISEFCELAPRENAEEQTSFNAEAHPSFEQLDEEWRNFANDLTPTEIKALKHLLNGDLSEFCRESGCLPQTLFEEINTNSLEAIGDIVIEDGGIIPDYAGEISRIVDAAGL